MLRLVRRGIAANLGRLSLTLLSIVLGVAFVSGSFVLADSLRSVFNNISETAFAGVDAQVRAVEPEIQSSAFGIVRFDGSVLDEVRAVPGVNWAEAGLFTPEVTYVIDDNGDAVRPMGPPVFSLSWSGPGPTSSFTLLEGSAPQGQQIALNKAQADSAGFEVGDMLTVSLPSGNPAQFELASIVEFGQEGGTGGAYFLLYDLATLQDILGVGNQVDSIVVNAKPGTDAEVLLADIEARLPEGLEAVSGETVIGESQADFGQVIDIFGNVLLGFAVVVLFVSVFIIYNTFAILVGQRTRQLGLLRSVGASGQQIRLMVLLESVIVGLLASLIGLFGGLAVASLLKWVFSLGGNAFPDGPLELRPRTVAVVFIVGLVVTVLSALLPAIRASRVSPLEAVRDGGRKDRSMRFRIVAGSVVLVPGLILLGVGMFGSLDSTAARLSAIGVGAALTFVGVSMLSALFAGPVAAALGRPVQAIKGTTGRIARDNASRNPQRTAATSTALMIGLALITGVTVLTASMLATFDDLLEDALTADVYVYEGQAIGFSAQVVDDLQALPTTEVVAAVTEVEAFIDGEIADVVAYDTATGETVISYGIVEGTADLGEHSIGVFVDKAEERGLSLGDLVTVEFEDGFSVDLTVGSIFDDKSLVEDDWVVDRRLSRPHLPDDNVTFVGVTFAEGVEADTGRASVESVTDDLPQLTVQDNSELQESVSGQISQLQYLMLGLLGLCLVVALIGIVNTMTLSVLERTREIGLLRAIGMTRPQLRSAVRWEAVVVGLFGTILGIAMGLLLGWAAVVAIPDSFISKIGIPWGWMLVYLIGGAIIGVLAAVLPARRAARMDVLTAIAHE